MQNKDYRVFPFYFPQFYSTEENNTWWGDGFTDWELVKSAKPVHKHQTQPRIPLFGYYDQSKPEVIETQAKLASDYGIDGFNFYHYWFDGKVLLEKPMENLYSNKNINIEYFITWANETWTRQWIGKPEDILIKQEHNVDETIWGEHYNYLRKFFLDQRYVKINNSPIMCVYRPELIKSLAEWIDFMNCKAKEDGFSGIHFIAMRAYEITDAERVYKLFNKVVNFQPRYSINNHLRNTSPTRKIIEKIIRRSPESLQLRLVSLFRKGKFREFSYKDYLKSLEVDPAVWNEKPVYQVVFPDWDNAARYKEKATFFSNTSATQFGEALDIVKDKISNHDDKLIFINAWNEWSEGAYLEPDDKNKYKYLEVIKHKFKL